MKQAIIIEVVHFISPLALFMHKRQSVTFSVPFDKLGKIEINLVSSENRWIVVLHAAGKGFHLEWWPNSIGSIEPTDATEVQSGFPIRSPACRIRVFSLPQRRSDARHSRHGTEENSFGSRFSAGLALGYRLKHDVIVPHVKACQYAWAAWRRGNPGIGGNALHSDGRAQSSTFLV